MGRGRKPKEKKGYFYEKEEQAVIDYIGSTDINKKNKIFNTILLPAFTKMIEAIIRRYKLYVPDEEFEETFNDTISYLMSKFGHYKPISFEYEEIEKLPDNQNAIMVGKEEQKMLFKKIDKDSPPYVITSNEDDIKLYKLVERKNKAFSYYQTICRNYLMAKGIQYVTNQKRNAPYDSVSEIYDNNIKYVAENNNSYQFAEQLIKKTSTEIQKMIDFPEKNNLNESEIKVGKALVELLDNWENCVLTEDSKSNKLQKNKVLYFLREETMMSTKIVRENMKKYFALYKSIKKRELEN